MLYKKGRYYMAKFQWAGKVIRKSTRCTSAKDARAVEGKIRSELARGNFGILEAKLQLTLAEFLKRDFLPYTESKFQVTPKTLAYYSYGVKSLLASDLGNLSIDRITGLESERYAARLSHLKPTTINCGLRTLRRALSLAVEWGKLDRRPKITLAKGEHQRDRVVTDAEAESYLGASPQPWQDVATLLLGTGMRPGEAYCLRWEQIYLNGNGGMIQILKGKSKAARRLLPMVPAVYRVLKARHAAQCNPAEGWVFPTGSASGHLEESSGKIQHAKALKDSKVNPFEPYCLRHTALTRLAAAGCDAFTLARIAGHSSITITQRYCHPQADAIDRAFAKMTGGQEVVTDGGHLELSTATSEESNHLVTLDAATR